MFRFRRNIRSALSVHAILDFNHQIPANALLFVTLAAMAVAGSRGPGAEEQERLGRLGRPLRIALAIGLVTLYGVCALDTWIGDAPVQAPTAKSQQLSDAYHESTRAITESPASGRPWAKLGKVYRRGGRPDLAIGRLPVQSADEANVLAEKIADQTMLLARSAGRHLEPQVGDVRQHLPKAADVTHISAGDRAVAWTAIPGWCWFPPCCCPSRGLR